MRLLFLAFTLPVLLSPQKIFESFDLDSKHAFIGTAKYEFSMADNGQNALTIENIIGDIIVTGKETSLVTIVEKTKIHHTSKLRAEKLYAKQKSMVTRSSDGNYVAIKGPGSHSHRFHYTYTMTLPEHFNLDIQITGGDVEIDHITGKVELHTGGGDLELSDITGKISARTSGGDIEVHDSEGNINVSTSGGDIDITYTDGQIKGKTSGGDLFVHHVLGNISVKTSGGSIEFNNIRGQEIVGVTSGGDIEIEDIRGDIEVKTSGGEITIEDVDGNVKGSTSGGDIELETVNGHVNISTSAGDITGENISGSIKAISSAGDIEIFKTWNRKLDDHAVDLKTSIGSIEIVLPKNFPARIDAVISDRWSEHDIESNLPINIATNDEGKKGTLTIADGNYAIQLKTNHGDIIIEED